MLVVLGLVIGAVVVTALQAEGRERSQANTNDGGAWLLKRDVGYVGHVNRAVGEVTAALSTSEPGSDYDIDQAKGVIVVHDRTAGTARAGRRPDALRASNAAGRPRRHRPRRRRRRARRQPRLDGRVEAGP